MRLLSVLIVLISSNSVFAEELDRTEINLAIQSITSVKLIYDGKEGVWFPKKDAGTLLTLVDTKLKFALDTIDNQDNLLDIKDKSIELYKGSSLAYAELASLNKQMYDVAMEHIPSINKKLSWYETPKATFVYGVIIGALVVVATTYLSIEALGAIK